MQNPLKSLAARFRYDDREMPFLDHLEEFRKTLIRSGIALAIGMILTAFFVPWMIQMFLVPAQSYLDSGRVTLQFHELTSGFKMWFSLSFWGGLVVSLPALMVIVGSFVLPGVRDTERRVIQRIAFFSGILFLVGIVVGYRITLPVAIDLLMKVNERLNGANILHYRKYIDFVLQVLLGFGVAFQLPVIIISLGKVGVLSSAQLRNKRRHVIVGIFILAMLLTPPDWATQVQMAIPLILLYEFCIWFLHFSERGAIRRKSREQHDDEAVVSAEAKKDEE
ncbi:MAG: twin-arginine translocase subunit TatC [Pontiellaceae bacterium]|nr:twin-arginine translocase subunit TatC [Pontiellaceae bacterium]